jgi:hypothetical protein
VFIAGSPVLLKGLTGWGMVNAFILGTTVFAAFGAGGFALVCIYFLFGTAVSVQHIYAPATRRLAMRIIIYTQVVVHAQMHRRVPPSLRNPESWVSTPMQRV